MQSFQDVFSNLQTLGNIWCWMLFLNSFLDFFYLSKKETFPFLLFVSYYFLLKEFPQARWIFYQKYSFNKTCSLNVKPDCRVCFSNSRKNDMKKLLDNGGYLQTWHNHLLQEWPNWKWLQKNLVLNIRLPEVT